MTRRFLLVLWSACLLCAPGLLAADPAAEKELTSLMEALRKAMMAKDAAALNKLMHPDLTYGHSSGLNETKAEAIAALTKGPTTIEAIDYSGHKIRVYGNTGLVKGELKMQNNSQGKVAIPQLDVLFVWLKGPAGWQLVARQATRLNP